jgi:hypothetical protein
VECSVQLLACYQKIIEQAPFNKALLRTKFPLRSNFSAERGVML